MTTLAQKILPKTTLHIVGSDFGRVPAVPVTTLNQASALYRAFVTEQGFGASQAGECKLKQGGKVVGHVSYNGKVWAGPKWTPDAKPLFDPSEVAL